MLFCLIVLACLLNQADSYYYGLPFKSFRLDNEGYGLYVNVSIGNPAQQAKLHLTLDYVETNPVFADGKQCSEGNYIANKSTTFVASPKRLGTAAEYGTDTLVLAEGFTHKNVILGIDVDNQGYCWNQFSILSLGYSVQAPSFVHDYLAQQKTQVAVVANNIDDPSTSGTLVLAEVPKDLCRNDWTYFPVQFNSLVALDWVATIDQIQVGNYVQAAPGGLSISISNFDFFLPQVTYFGVVNALGIDNSNLLDCSAKTNVELTINGTKLVIGPDTYLDAATKDKNGKCQTRFKGGWLTIDLPITFLTKKCLLLDLDKKQLALATKK
ncbi:hypothetical protein M3Y97_01096700 [Aphelenchoides bicaudatus]|nr:hypothetical protein M3Y97_01096700 [Aphelenchoides bicaudatus]